MIDEKMALHGAIEKAPTRTHQVAVLLNPEVQPLWSSSFMKQVLTSEAVLAKVGCTKEQLEKKASEGVQVIAKPKEIVADGEGGSGRTHYVGICNLVDGELASHVIAAYRPVSCGQS